MPHWFHRPDGTDGICDVHGATHCLRVATHAYEIAEEIGLAEAEHDAVHLAGLWHDIGRDHAGVDSHHGAKSAGKAVGLGLHRDTDPHVVELALFAMTHHCGSEEHAERAARYTTDPAATLRVFRLLKDADALDRVRLHSGLDPSFLRYPESHGHIDRAWELLEKIQ
jgi:HD superfamily phosphodiesterase